MIKIFSGGNNNYRENADSVRQSPPQLQNTIGEDFKHKPSLDSLLWRTGKAVALHRPCGKKERKRESISLGKKVCLKKNFKQIWNRHVLKVNQKHPKNYLMA